MGSALVFGGRTVESRAALEARFWRVLGTGAGVLALGAGLAGVLASLPNGALKLLAWLVVGALMATAALGGGALILALGERLQPLAPGLSPLSRLCRAASLLVGAQYVPLFGWFLLAPLSFVLSLGLGWHVLRRKKATASAPQPLSVQPLTPQPLTPQPLTPQPLTPQAMAPEFAPVTPLSVTPVAHASHAEAQR